MKGIKLPRRVLRFLLKKRALPLPLPLARNYLLGFPKERNENWLFNDYLLPNHNNNFFTKLHSGKERKVCRNNNNKEIILLPRRLAFFLGGRVNCELLLLLCGAVIESHTRDGFGVTSVVTDCLPLTDVPQPCCLIR